MLTIRLFGPITVEVDGKPLPALRSRQGFYILSLLTLRANREVSRLWLAGEIWPESDDDRGLENLRRSLTNLRQALGPEKERIQQASKRTLFFQIDPEQVDVLAFDAALKEDSITSLEKAIQLYRAPLLEGDYEVWMRPEREARQEAYLAAVERYATLQQAKGNLAAALPALREALVRDPLREGLCRMLMEALAETGNPAAAAEVYREFRTGLLREGNGSPSAALTAVYNRIRTEGSTPPPPPSVAAAPKKASPRYALPRPLTELIGREQELEAIAACLGNACLVTLTGTGGIGKTRLALQTAWNQQAVLSEGACFVELAPLLSASQLPQATASALGVQETDEQPLLETLVDYLKPRALLLVLDNCEHLVDGCADFAGRLLRDCPHLQILCTSRQPLGVTGEVVWRVPILAIPPPGGAFEDLVERYAALRLFFERARAVQPNLVLNAATVQAAIEICRHLDGIALAIELAAARVKSLSVEQIAARLDDRFRLLTGGSRNALPRQQTLRALIDWSYDILPERERLLFAQLSIFSDSYTLEAAEAICAEDDTFELLDQLVDKSLVLAEEGVEGTVRYRMLETIREYSRTKLDPEQRDVLEARFLSWYLARAIDAEPKLIGGEQAHWLRVMDQEHNNLRQALTLGDSQQNLLLCATLARYWYLRNHWTEGRNYLQAAVARPEVQDPTPLRAKALMGAGNLASRQGNYEAATGFYTECLEIRRALDDRSGTASVLNSLATAIKEQGDYERARQLYHESLALCEELEDQTGMARANHNLGMIANEQGDNETALVFYTAAITLSRALGDPFLEANDLNNLGNVAIDQGDYKKAREYTEQALALYRGLGVDTGIAFCLDNLGRIALVLGDYAGARVLIDESLKLNQELGDQRGIAISLNNLGLVALAQGELSEAQGLLLQSIAYRNWPSVAGTLVALGHLALRQGQLPRAAALYGAAEQLCEQMKRALSLLETRLRDEDIDLLVETLGQAAFDQSYTDGRSLTPDEAVLLAMQR